jgi:RHS repeat-associated protein
MLRLLLLFLIFISSLRADWDQLFSDDEDPTLFHHVNVITGNLNLCLEDGVIEGAKSLPIFRTYSSAGALEPRDLNAELKTERGGWIVQGGWNFLPHANLWIDLFVKPKHFRIYLPEPGGNLIPYSYEDHKSDHILIFKPKKGFGQCSGNLSAKTNVGNNILELHLKKGIAVLLLPNGGSRTYKGKDFHHWDIHHWRGRCNERRLKCCYRLKEEVLPSRHKIHYSYDHKDCLEHVALMNPSETKTLAWMHLKLMKKDSPFVLGLNTSDGKSFQYKTMEFKGTDYICGVHSSHRAEEGIAYIQGRKRIGARIRRMDLGGKFQFEAKYYIPPNEKKAEKWAEEPEKKYFETDKVHILEAPIGPHGEIIPFAQFSYRPGVTEVRDSANRLTRYTHDAGRLSSIEHCNERDEVVSILKFIWVGDRLQAKAMLDGQHRAHFSKVFNYDSVGNVVCETLWGSLTGAIAGPFSLSGDGSLSSSEHYSKRYEYLPRFNIPTLEEEENGLTYTYRYKNDTDLPIAKFTSYTGKILIREFLFYNEDNLLIAEITDDGDSSDPSDLHQVTERQIKRYDLDPSSGLNRYLTESYLDRASGSEVLLRKVGYSYSPECRVVTEVVFDAAGVHRYTIHTDYDPQGRVVRKTTPLSQENIYSYDSVGNLLFAKEVSHPSKTFTYDPAGRPASMEESDHLGRIGKSFTQYDAHGNLLSQTDAKGNTIEQLYNAFGRCIKTQFPVALDQEGSPYSPAVIFTYDLQGNLSSTSVLEGGTTQTFYNTLRKPVQIVQADGTLVCHRYFKDGTLAQTIHSDGTHSDYLYDMFQRVVSKKIYSVEGELLSAEKWTYNAFHLLSYTDPNGLTTYYTYDGAGRKVAEQAESKVTTYTYDSLGFLEKTTEADISHVLIHDTGGRVIEEWQESADGRIENHNWFFYDSENRKIQADRMTSQGKVTDLFFYDRESRLTRHIDPEGNQTEFLYNETETNALGQRVLQKATVDPCGHSTIETYDALNRVVCQEKKDPYGNPVAKEELFYDKAGNQARRISTVYHDHAPKSHISVQWEYDLMGRVITESEGSDKTAHFAYDERGRVKRRLLPSGVAIDSIYDGIDRLMETKSSDGTVHYHYVYAEGPQPIEIADLIHHTLLQREYNVFGQIVKEINPYGLTFTWQYDHHGRCAAYTLPDLSSIAYLYKGGHLTEVSRLSSSGNPLYSHRYFDFDPNGHVMQEGLIHNMGTLHTTRDLLERLKAQHSPWLHQMISYGPSSLVTQTKNSLLGDKTYAHDALNQLVQEGDERHAFDSLGNPIHCSVNAHNQILSGPGYSLEYDRNGNPIRKISSEGSTVYTYDAFNRLTSITHPDSKQSVYFYDPLSRLIAEQSEGAQTLYLYDKTQEMGAMNARGAITQLKVTGLGLAGEIGGSVAIELEGIAYAPLHDFQGNIIALISANQKIVESYQIDAFGKEKNDLSSLNPWRFSSKRSMGGLILFGQRFYDPALGRWLTPDPSGFADGPNLYVYVLNSPLNRLDLFGLASDPLFPPDFRLEVPLHALLPARVVPVSSILPCKGFLSDVPVDWIVSCGHWHKLQFTPQEWIADKVNIVDHFHELVPTEGSTVGLITVQNGIGTTKSDLGQNVRSVVNMVPEGTLTFGMYNPTQGLIKDCTRTFSERGSKDTPIVVTTRQYMVAISETLHKLNPDLLWLHIAHSEGGVVGRNAIKGMTEDQKGLLKNQLYFLGLGPAKPIPLECGRGVMNIYSKQDFITGWFALKYKNDPKYDVRFVPCRSTFSERTAYFADHAFLGGTYQGVQRDEIDKLRGKYGFYDGKIR